MAAKYRNSGQTCVTANKIMIHRNIYDEFLNKFKTATQQLKVNMKNNAVLTFTLKNIFIFKQVGDGTLDDTKQGPIINSKQLSRIERIVKESISQGAVLEMGGAKLGNCFTPTILTGVKGSTVYNS